MVRFLLALVLCVAATARADKEFPDKTPYGANSQSPEAKRIADEQKRLREASLRNARASKEPIGFKWGDLHFGPGNPDAFLNFVSVIKTMQGEAAQGSTVHSVDMGDTLNWDAGNFDEAKLKELGDKVAASGNADAVRMFQRFRKLVDEETERATTALNKKNVTDDFRNKDAKGWARFVGVETAMRRVMAEEVQSVSKAGQKHQFVSITGNHGIHYNDEINKAQQRWDAARNRAATMVLLHATSDPLMLIDLKDELEIKTSEEGKRLHDSLLEVGEKFRKYVRESKAWKALLARDPGAAERREQFLNSGLLDSSPEMASAIGDATKEIFENRDRSRELFGAMDLINQAAHHHVTGSNAYKFRDGVQRLLNDSRGPYFVGPYPMQSQLDANGLAVAELRREANDRIGQPLLTDRPEEMAFFGSKSGKYIRGSDLERMLANGTAKGVFLPGEAVEAFEHYPDVQGDFIRRTRHLFYSLKKVSAQRVHVPYWVKTLYHGDDHSRTRTIGPHYDAPANGPNTGFQVVDTGTAGAKFPNSQPGRYTLVVTADGRSFHDNLDVAGHGLVEPTVLTPGQSNTALPAKMSADNGPLLVSLAQSIAPEPAGPLSIPLPLVNSGPCLFPLGTLGGL